jgi:hypothetical protein
MKFVFKTDVFVLFMKSYVECVENDFKKNPRNAGLKLEHKCFLL